MIRLDILQKEYFVIGHSDTWGMSQQKDTEFCGSENLEINLHKTNKVIMI